MRASSPSTSARSGAPTCSSTRARPRCIEELHQPLRSASDTFPWPHVIRLLHYVRVPRAVKRKISRRALFARDGHIAASTAARPAGSRSTTSSRARVAATRCGRTSSPRALRATCARATACPRRWRCACCQSRVAHAGALRHPLGVADPGSLAAVPRRLRLGRKRAAGARPRASRSDSGVVVEGELGRVRP